jgi:hypothetical protein
MFGSSLFIFDLYEIYALFYTYIIRIYFTYAGVQHDCIAQDNTPSGRSIGMQDNQL